MRLIPVCLPLVLAPLIVAGQQAQPTTSQKPAQKTAVKQTVSPSPHKTATRHRARHRSRKAALRKKAKKQESTTLPVDVITGGDTRRVLLNKNDTADSGHKTARGQMKVEVINGSAADTQFFSDRNQESAHNQAVVVGVQSSDTRSTGINKSPVVTGVTSSSTVDAKSASSGGQAVTRQVSPRPKRPAYEPDGH